MAINRLLLGCARKLHCVNAVGSKLILIETIKRFYVPQQPDAKG